LSVDGRFAAAVIAVSGLGPLAAAPLIALIYLCCGGIEIDLPFS